MGLRKDGAIEYYIRRIAAAAARQQQLDSMASCVYIKRLQNTARATIRNYGGVLRGFQTRVSMCSKLNCRVVCCIGIDSGIIFFNALLNKWARVHSAFDYKNLVMSLHHARSVIISAHVFCQDGLLTLSSVMRRG
jgi:hypothetical protein